MINIGPATGALCRSNQHPRRHAHKLRLSGLFRPLRLLWGDSGLQDTGGEHDAVDLRSASKARAYQCGWKLYN